MADQEESLALEAAKEKKRTSQREEFFYNFGRIWRMKVVRIYETLAIALMRTRKKLRVQCTSTKLRWFHAAYDDVKEGDGIWRSPEDRVLFGDESDLILKIRKSIGWVRKRG